MARRISTGKVGRNVLGALSTTDNTIISVVEDEDIILDPSGTGEILAEANVFIQDAKRLKLGDSDSSNFIGINAPTTVSANWTLTLPTTAGTSGYALTTDGSGGTTWTDLSLVIGDDIASDTSNDYNITMTTATNGGINTLKVVSTKLTFSPDTGTLTTTALVESSSIALKENLNPITNALDKILQLNAFTYDRKDGSSKNEAGLIAEEVAEVLPNLVSRNNKGEPFGINYTKLSAYLIEAVKTLSAEVDKLKQDK